MPSSQSLEIDRIHRRYDEDDDNDDNDNDSDDGNDWTESDVDTYVSDEAVSLDDELIRVYDLADHWGEDNNMGSNEFPQELIDDTERQNAQYNLVDRSRSVTGSGMLQARSIDDAEEGIDDDDDIMDWTTTSDDDSDEISQRWYSWPLIPSYQTVQHLQFNPIGNMSLTDHIIMPPHCRRRTSMNSFYNIQSQQSRGYFYPSFPNRRWSFNRLP